MHGMNVRENTVSIHTGIHMYTVIAKISVWVIL